MFSIRIVSVLILSLFFCHFLWSSTSQPIQKGTSVEQVLRQYQMNGMKILYSSRLVNAEMVVKYEPRSGSPRGMLDQVLRPHGLKISSGPAGTLLVVPDQDRTPSDKPVSRIVPQIEEQVNVPFVTIYITAKDDDNQFLTSLKAEDFVLTEDGAEQQITEFTNFSDAEEFPEDTEPLTIMMLIDNSASMNDLREGKRKFDFVREAALRLIDQLRPNDQVMVMGFNETPWVISELTADKDSIREKLKADAELRARTALYDLLAHAVKQMHNFPGRRVLLLCSDGLDSASKTKLEDTLKFLQTSDVTIFAIGTDDRHDIVHKGRDVMKKISDITAGYSFVSSSDTELNASIDKVRMTLRSQYAAGYIPPSPTIHKWRRVRIYCKIPGVKLRYRNQYLF